MKDAKTGRFLREKLISDHGLFSSYEGQQGAKNGKARGAFFRDAQGFGHWMLARVPASRAQGLYHHGSWYYHFPYIFVTCGLDELGLVDQNGLECDLSALLLRMLAMGRRQPSETIEAARDMEHVKRF